MGNIVIAFVIGMSIAPYILFPEARASRGSYALLGFIILLVIAIDVATTGPFSKTTPAWGIVTLLIALPAGGALVGALFDFGKWWRKRGVS